MNIRVIQQSVLCLVITMFSVSCCMNEQSDIILVEQKKHVGWKSPVAYNISGSKAKAELLETEDGKELDIKISRKGRASNIDFLIMECEGPGFVSANDKGADAGDIGAPYMHGYGECFNSVFEQYYGRKKIKQLLLNEKNIIVAYACTYELKPFDMMNPWHIGEIENFYNFPALLKAFLHSTQKRYETWFGAGSRCYYKLDGVTLPANYKKARKNPNAEIGKYTLYDALPEEVKQVIDEHYANQKVQNITEKVVENILEEVDCILPALIIPEIEGPVEIVKYEVK